MDIDVRGVSITLTDEQLQHINSEIQKKNNKISAEEEFLNFWNGCTIKFDFSESDSIFLLKDNMVLFEQDFKNDRLWCHDDKIWSVLESKYSMNNKQTQDFIKNILERHLKLGTLTPFCAFKMSYRALERNLKFGTLTPKNKRRHRLTYWKDVSNWV